MDIPRFVFVRWLFHDILDKLSSSPGRSRDKGQTSTELQYTVQCLRVDWDCSMWVWQETKFGRLYLQVFASTRSRKLGGWILQVCSCVFLYYCVRFSQPGKTVSLNWGNTKVMKAFGLMGTFGPLVLENLTRDLLVCGSRCFWQRRRGRNLHLSADKKKLWSSRKGKWYHMRSNVGFFWLGSRVHKMKCEATTARKSCRVNWGSPIYGMLSWKSEKVTPCGYQLLVLCFLPNQQVETTLALYWWS